MGKRSEFERRKNDLYETFDSRALKALLPHLMPNTRFAEPCAGRFSVMAVICVSAWLVLMKGIGAI